MHLGGDQHSQQQCQEWVTAVRTERLLQAPGQHWGSGLPGVSSYYPNVPYKNDHFLRVQGYEKDWAELSQVTFHVSSTLKQNSTTVLN